MILITGASGFLGGRLLQLLAKKNLPIRALYHNRKPSVEKETANVEWKKCNLLDIFEVEEAMEGITEVYHCAAIVSFDPRRKKEMIHNNVTATENIVNISIENNIKKMIYVSSVAALGRVEVKEESRLDISENTHWQDSKSNSNYAISKYKSEMEVWRGVAEGLKAVIVNPGIILGIGDWNSGGSVSLLQTVAKGFPFYTEGITSWVDVDDVAHAMHMLMDSKISGERYIISSGNYSYKSIFGMMASSLGIAAPHKKANKWMSEIVWRWEYLKSVISKKPIMISKESARAVHKQCYYNNNKLLNTLPDFVYKPINQTIQEMAKAYIKDTK